MKRSSIISPVFCITLFFCSYCMAGSLQPTAPPASTMKTLDQVEPRIPIPGGSVSTTYEITNSGSYYLTGNRTVNADVNGISVEANDVTIDLCGFSLKGNNTRCGICMTNRTNVEIRNGTIRNFEHGISDEALYTGARNRLIELRVLSNVKSGINLKSSSNEIRDCMVSDNGSSAPAGISVLCIAVGNSSIITGNTITYNGDSAQSNVYAIKTLYGCTVSGNTIYYNGNSGTTVYGILTDTGCTITGNTISANGYSADSVYGIITSQGCTINGNTIFGNGSSAATQVNGIRAGSQSSVIGNTVQGNGIMSSGTVIGINLAGNNFVDQNTSCGNSGTNMNNPGNCTFGLNHAP